MVRPRWRATMERTQLQPRLWADRLRHLVPCRLDQLRAHRRATRFIDVHERNRTIQRAAALTSLARRGGWHTECRRHLACQGRGFGNHTAVDRASSLVRAVPFRAGRRAPRAIAQSHLAFRGQTAQPSQLALATASPASRIGDAVERATAVAAFIAWHAMSEWIANGAGRQQAKPIEN